jgi:RNA polymerase sigma factor (TIGR02999 family)
LIILWEVNEVQMQRMDPTPGEITQLLIQVTQGNHEAESRLIPLVYNELRRLARRYMRNERPDHTLQATALVHEAYLRLTNQKDADWQNRAHFFAVAAQMMRRILVDHARAHRAQKRGGREPKVSLDEALAFTEDDSERVMAIDEALTRLAERDPRLGRNVELRFFAGLTDEEVAEALGVSIRTVKRDWRVAKAWLRGELSS